ncbi:MAG: pirin family protein [Rhodocyclaceae bacterium]|nr:pirin family protein [Rhodocyclaceae bacterium]
MISLRKDRDRGYAHHGWLETRHSFSFGDYHDPAEMGWSVLRVINDDIVAPSAGFGRHGHRDMEIVTYMLSGMLRHGDSMENSKLLRRPEVQRMSAGAGVLHSEANASTYEPVRLLQIWIQPDVCGIPPEYEQRIFDDAEKRGRLRPLVSPDGREGSMRIHQDATVYASLLDPGASLAHSVGAGRRAYLHLIRGNVTINGQSLGPGDAAKIADEAALQIVAADEAELLLFDLP